MILANSELMRLSESRVMEIFNVDEELLMEIVAVKVADRILKITGNVKDKHFLVFAGRGKNGGDAIAIARHLILQGAKISAFLIDDGGGSFSPLLQLQIDRLKKIAPDSMRDFNFQEIRGDFVIDGLFGTGFKGEMREPYNSVVRYINNLNIPIISIDVPSGLDASTGRVSSNCIHANYTFTLGLAKLGLFIYPGAGYGGEISLIDLGFPLDRYTDSSFNLIDESVVKGVITRRNPDTHKGTYGRVGIVAGSYNYPGASVLVTKGALASGTGLVTLFITSNMFPMIHSIDPEVTFYPRENFKELFPVLSSIVVGPGLGKVEPSFLEDIITSSTVPVLLDADGLNSIAGSLDILKSSNIPIVITPHPGEMSRLIGKSVSFVQDNRIDVASDFSREYGVITILKGARTVIASPSGEIYINPTGNPSMATGGMGDVLSGLIGGFIARGLSPVSASILGVYIHGLAGDVISREKERVLAQEVASEIPRLLGSIVSD